MDKAAQIKDKIREIVGLKPDWPFSAVVTKVENDYCTIELPSGLKISHVKLKATITEGNNYLKVIPKVGSKVTVFSLSGDMNNLAVIKFNEVEKLEYAQDGLKIIIDSTDKKVAIKNDQVSLHDVLLDLSTAIKQLKVFTPVGPSGTPLPDTITAIEAFETKFKQLLK